MDYPQMTQTKKGGIFLETILKDKLPSLFVTVV